MSPVYPSCLKTEDCWLARGHDGPCGEETPGLCVRCNRDPAAGRSAYCTDCESFLKSVALAAEVVGDDEAAERAAIEEAREPVGEEPTCGKVVQPFRANCMRERGYEGACSVARPAVADSEDAVEPDEWQSIREHYWCGCVRVGWWQRCSEAHAQLDADEEPRKNFDDNPKRTRRATPAPREEALRTVLREHWLTAIDCDHEAKTDTARCYCTRWTGAPQPNVGAAVEEWIAHVLAALASLPASREKPLSEYSAHELTTALTRATSTDTESGTP